MSGNGDRPELPEGWEWQKLSELGTWVGGGTPSKNQSSYWEGGTVPWVSPKDMKQWRLSATQDKITEEAVEHSSAKFFPAGSVALVVRSGILEHTLPVALVPFRATANQDMRVITPKAGIDPEWLMYALQAEAELIRQSCRKDGTTVASIDVPRLAEWALPVPPVEEQVRIVRRVELLLSEIDTGLEAVSRARAGVARLLRATAEAEVRRLEEEGCQMVPAAELSADAPYSLAIGPFGSNLKVSDYADSGVPLVFVRNIRAEKFGDAGTKFVSHEKAATLRAHRVQGGDLLVTKMGDPPGDCAIYPLTAPDAIITSDCIRFEVDRAVARPDYVAALFLTAQVKKQVRERTKGVAQKKVSLKTFRSIHFPLPDLRRQDAVVARLNHVREAQGTLSQAIQAAEAQGSRLERSFFRAAFRGGL